VPEIDDLLVARRYHCPGDILHQSPANPSAAAGIDETVLRAGVEGIHSVHELWVENHIALLTAGDQVRQAFPCHEVMRAGDAGSGDC